MQKYKKKPEYIEAIQYLEYNEGEIPHLQTHKGCGYRMCDICGGGNPTEIIKYIHSGRTFVIVRKNDWVIKDENGHYSTCSPSRFESTYVIVKK